MKVHVQLPTNLLIDYWDFCKAIAEAVHPTGERGLEGVECICAKRISNLRVAHPDNGPLLFEAGMQSVLTSEDSRTLDQLLSDLASATKVVEVGLPLAVPVRLQVFEYSLPLSLTDDELRALENLLPQLPPLRYPMSTDDEAAFMEAYLRLKDRPEWIPVLLNAAAMERRKAKQAVVMRHHQRTLQEEVAEGRLIVVNKDHLPVAIGHGGCFIPRKQAIAYLERHGIGQEIAGDRDDVASGKLQVVPEPPSGKQGFDRPKLGPEREGELLDRYDELKRQGIKNFSKATAQQFQISDSYLRRLLRARAQKNSNRIDQMLVRRGK